MRNEDLAKDCVQDMFVSLWQNHDTTPIENLNPYLHQVVRFCTVSFDERLVSFTAIMLQDDTVVYKDLKTVPEGLTDHLPEDQRLIFRPHIERV